MIDRLKELKNEANQGTDILDNLMNFISKAPSIKKVFDIHAEKFDDQIAKLLSIENKNFDLIHELIELLDIELIQKYESQAIQNGVDLSLYGYQYFISAHFQSDSLNISCIIDTLKRTNIKVLDCVDIHKKRAKALIDFIDNYGDFVRSLLTDKFNDPVVKNVQKYQALRGQILKLYNEANLIIDNYRDDLDFWVLHNTFIAKKKLGNLSRSSWSDTERIAYGMYTSTNKKLLFFAVLNTLIDELSINKEILDLKSEKKDYANDRVYKISYNEFTSEISCNGKTLSRPHFDSINGKFFQFVYANPNRDINISEMKLDYAKDPHKIVEQLKFKGDIKKAFFRVSKTTVLFRNPISLKSSDTLNLPFNPN